MNRNRMIALVLVLTALVAVRFGFDWGPRSTVAPKGRVSTDRVRAVTQDVAEVVKLRLDLLDRERPVYAGIKRNIFSPIKLASDKPVVKKAVEPKPVPAAAPPSSPKPLFPPTPPEPVVVASTALQQFTAAVSFVGFLEKEKDRTVFLSRDDDIFLVKAGDLIDGRFRVAEITETTLKLTDVASNDVSTITLVE